ncbi:MAG: hypothetical protein CL777_05970 [Chloroflexi bacterium]|nr:hypothetical protein [Chloroflexota bacterium]|tara:strand:+ start:561 stop:1112 length:552 start_codon:yes stop_codon:yes gene_type:complete
MELDFQINVSQLLKTNVGSVKKFGLDQAILDLEAEDSASKIDGEVLLTRTDRGVWVSGIVEIYIALECSRCLVHYSSLNKIAIDDEFLPSVDINSGAKLRYADTEINQDTYSIDAHHVLDLSEALRQYRLSTMPIAPLCRVDCKGICTECGIDLNVSSCSCEPYQDQRWAKLRELLNTNGTIT